MANGSTRQFGQRIAKYRQRLGWNQTHAAQVMKVQRTSLNRWEQGHEMPRGENMTKLRDHLRMPIGTEEDEDLIELSHDQASGGGYQLSLPFDQPIDLELRLTRKDMDSIRLQFRAKRVVS